MIGSLSRACLVLGCVVALTACRPTAPPPVPEPAAPQTSGTLQVSGLRAPVTVVRDTWGIPHITASNDDDLFFAQGFVQGQDRLFQMDLWKKAAQGRLSEVLGANFIDRDAMTRRVQFRGDIDQEWASYGPDTRPIARAFTSGINAWVAHARTDLPEEFVLAGWTPEFWKPEDLLNRTDAFLASGNAADELLRARLVAALGASRVEQLLPIAADERLRPDPSVDLSAVTYVVPDTLRRIGTPPFFLTLAAQASEAPRPSRRNGTDRASAGTDLAADPDLPLPAPAGEAWVVGGARSVTGVALLATQGVHPFDVPARRYLVHLSAPGLNVIGVTSPWLPGVVVGHNERIAWGVAGAPFDTQDVFVERLNPADPHQVEHDGRWVDMAVDHERVDIKGRDRPFEYDREYTPNGVVIALDRERGLVYTLRWSGTEPGAAAELAAVSIDRARTWPEFQTALSRWKMPTTQFVYADVDGRTARRPAGLVPVRQPGIGSLVSAGWNHPRAWNGWIDLSMPRSKSSATGEAFVADGGNAGRSARIAAILAQSDRRSLDALRALQADVRVTGASLLIPLVARIQTFPNELEAVRARLSAWDGEATADSAAAQTYLRWESAMRRLLAERLVPSEFVPQFARRIDIVDVVTRPRAPWFDARAGTTRDALLVQALASAVEDEHQQAQADDRGARLVLKHPLAVFDAARRRFDVGPLPRPGNYDTVFATDRRSGPTFRALFDLADWDRSLAITSPGQSGSASSPHYDDLADAWVRGQDVPLPFSAGAVKAATKDTLTLVPTVSAAAARAPVETSAPAQQASRTVRSSRAAPRALLREPRRTDTR